MADHLNGVARLSCCMALVDNQNVVSTWPCQEDAAMTLAAGLKIPPHDPQALPFHGVEYSLLIMLLLEIFYSI